MPHFCVAGVALGVIDLHLAWQAWHFVTSTFVLRDRRDTFVTGLGLVARLVPLGRPGRSGTFAWQEWRLVLSTFTWRGKRGTW